MKKLFDPSPVLFMGVPVTFRLIFEYYLIMALCLGGFLLLRSIGLDPMQGLDWIVLQMFGEIQ